MCIKPQIHYLYAFGIIIFHKEKVISVGVFDETLAGIIIKVTQLTISDENKITYILTALLEQTFSMCFFLLIPVNVYHFSPPVLITFVS